MVLYATQPKTISPADPCNKVAICLITTGTVHDGSSPGFQAINAGALYAITVFSIGFILGTIRVLLLAPRLGETTAVIIEAPIMLAASWFICRWCVDRLDVRRTVPVRSLMSLVGFAVLMSAEVGLGAVLGRSPARTAYRIRAPCPTRSASPPRSFL